MKSSIRQRGSGASQENGKQRKVSWDPNIPEDPAGAISDLETPLLSGPLVITFVLLLSSLCAVSVYFFNYLPPPMGHGDPNDFLAANSRAHMEDLVSLGIRHVGSDANEIHAKAMLIEKIKKLKAIASSRVEIELSVQEVSGNFYLDFLGGMTHVYQNISNIAVRVSRKSPPPSGYAFLINAHYDSALGTVAASDDAVSCGTMLEAIRCLSSDPDPLLGNHSLIFLFNGAEETILQASHGFVTKHPWAKQARAFLNLEAAGAGGREIVFQTGPDHPWLARLYARVVPHPHASVVAQEIFQAGLIPSDTDFRIFRDYGNIPGIDTAYFINGYVYHTEYDVPSAIPDGSIQRAGENVLAILREVANAPELADPTEEDTKGKMVFFDIMGLMTVVYPDSEGTALNYTLAILALFSVLWGVALSEEDKTSKPTLLLVIKTMVVMKISWLAAVAMVAIIGLFLSNIGRSLSWFAHPLLIIPLYVVPSVLVIGEVNVQWMKWNRGMVSRKAMEKSSFLATQLLLSLVLLLMTTLGLSSAFIPLLLVTTPLLFRTFLLETLITPELNKSHDHSLYGLAYTLCCFLGTGLPMMLSIQLDVGLMQMFVPLTGRMGSLVSPDLLIGIAAAALVAFHSPHMLYVLIFASSASLKRWSGVLLLVVFGSALFLAGSGYIPPYSLADPNHPRPKRFYLMHTDKTFFNADGSVNNTDSLIHIYSFDYLDIAPIAEVVPEFQQAKPFKCQGLYCREPMYIPVKHVHRSSWYLPAPPLDHLEPASLTVSDVTVTGNKRNITLSAKFPKRGTMYIAPTKGNKMAAWSLESYIPPATPCPGEYESEGCYFVFLARGFGDGEFSFWIQTEGDTEGQSTLEVAFASHHLDPPHSQTERLEELQKTLPEWVSSIAWTSKYLRWLF